MSTNNRDRRHKGSPRQFCSCSSVFLIVLSFGGLALVSVLLFESHLSALHSSAIFDWSTRSLHDTIKQTKVRIEGVKVPPLQLTESFSSMQPYNKGNGSTQLHFIHIPKCGGTSMTAILREVACKANPVENVDCCTNPGFCDWHSHRRCATIKGCTNHIPQRRLIFESLPSVTILREPLSRILSAWFYRGHTPNNDFFQVRGYFKEIREGKRPQVLFDEYIEMPEYQNIQTRMLGADSFPYKNVTITAKVFQKAVEALDNIFFVGIQEEYDLSVQVMIRELGVPLKADIKKERDQQKSASLTKQKEDIKSNEVLTSRMRVVNSFDLDLYQLAFKRFCVTTKKYPDLYAQLKGGSKARCETASPRRL